MSDFNYFDWCFYSYNTENENLKPWLNFFFNILTEQATQAIELISTTEVLKLLSPQQQKIWEYILKQDTEVTPPWMPEQHESIPE